LGADRATAKTALILETAESDEDIAEEIMINTLKESLYENQ